MIYTTIVYSKRYIVFDCTSMQTRKQQIYTIIFKTDTKAWKWFDMVLLLLIVISVSIVMARSVDTIETAYKTTLIRSQHIITWLFTIEYILRIRSSHDKKAYIWSFFGIIDLLSLLPWYIWVFASIEQLIMLRSLRLLRLFRIFKLGTYTKASSILRYSLKASTAKIAVFLFTVFIIVLIVGTLIYLIEWPAAWFNNIPTGVYRAVVTITTVWYGDLTPITPLGQLLSAVLMVMWYGIIAVPTGLVSAELTSQHFIEQNKKSDSTAHIKKN